MLRTLCIALVILESILATYVQARAQNLVTISDGTFNNSDWTMAVFTDGNGGSASVSQAVSGGNPQSYRQISMSINPNPSDVTPVSLYTPTVYTPSLQGAITSLDWGEDDIALSDFQATVLVVEQGGVYYGADYYFATATTWLHHSRLGLLPSDFTAINAMPGASHPDFSASGGPILFGYGKSNGSGPVVRFTSGGVDNWSVTIHSTATPEPDAWVSLAGLGFAGSVWFRLRRRKRSTHK